MMSDETQKYVDSNEASILLGEKPATLFYHVDRGEIEVIGERRERRYKVADILQVKARRQAKKRKPAPVLLDWLYAADVPAGLKLSMAVYPGEVDLAEAAIYQSWRKNNPYLTMAAFSPDRQECYASVQLVPLRDEQVILDVLSGRREEASIQPDEIPGYDQPGPYYLLVTSATCLKDRPLLLYQVLYKYIDFWVDMFPDRYIKRVYAQAVSESGMRIVQHFFMAPRPDLAYNAFMIDMQWPQASKMMSHLKKTLERKAPLPIDLQWPPQLPTIAIAPTVSPVLYDAPQPKPRIIREPQPRQEVPAVIPSELPPGTLALRDFAAALGVDRTTLLEQVKTQRAKGNPAFEHIEIPKPGQFTKDGTPVMERFFTPAQQEQVKQWRAAHPHGR